MNDIIGEAEKLSTNIIKAVTHNANIQACDYRVFFYAGVLVPNQVKCDSETIKVNILIEMTLLILTFM